MMADMMTKALARIKVEKFIKMAGLIDANVARSTEGLERRRVYEISVTSMLKMLVSSILSSAHP
jgi:hypothetical protein